MTIPFWYRHKAGAYYSIAVCDTDSPFAIYRDSLMVIDWSIAPDHPQCRFMADPFIVNHNDTLYIFYEHFPAKANSTWGDVGVLRSDNGGITWTYEGIAIDEPYHLSFPNVFFMNGEWYMLPSSGVIDKLVLYRATDFPLKWESYAVLKKEFHYSDPMLYYYESTYYLFVSENNEEKFSLYVADSLTDPYREHPCSPIRCGWNNYTRLAGNVTEIDGNADLFMQEHNGGYGTAVAIFKVDSISPTFYHDSRYGDIPLISKSGYGWNADGMHTFNTVMYDSTWICVMDGSRLHEREIGWDWKNFPKFR